MRRNVRIVAGQFTAGLFVAGALALSGCAAESGATGEAVTAGNVKSGYALKAEGALTASIDGGQFSVDYGTAAVTYQIQHKLNKDANGLACVPDIKLTAARADGSCKLELEFRPTFDGTQLELGNARFYALSGLKQDGVVIKYLPCDGWTPKEVKVAGLETVYEKVGGEAFLPMPTLSQPLAGQSKATLANLFLQPSGIVKMKYKGRLFDLDLGKLVFKGNAQSIGSDAAELQCAKTFFDLPAWQLPDINPQSPGYKTIYGLDAFRGKRVVVMMGAGWCASCISQAKSMEKIRKSLQAQGRSDFVVIAFNDDSASSASNQKQITDGNAFPIFQGAWAKHAPTELNGKPYIPQKNDAFAYDYNGRMMGYFQGAGTVNMGDFEKFVTTNLMAPKEEAQGLTCLVQGNGRSCTVTP